jgi:hypothetical protein
MYIVGIINYSMSALCGSDWNSGGKGRRKRGRQGERRKKKWGDRKLNVAKEG